MADPTSPYVSFFPLPCTAGGAGSYLRFHLVGSAPNGQSSGANFARQLALCRPFPFSILPQRHVTRRGMCRHLGRMEA